MCEIQERHDKRCGHLVEMSYESCEDACGNWEVFNWHTHLVRCGMSRCVELRRQMRRFQRTQRRMAINQFPSSPRAQELRSDDTKMEDKEEPQVEHKEKSMPTPKSATATENQEKRRDFWGVI
ncbi:hypothetical protein QC762_0023110 [Podospora pseudocomata]|uniref:Uncharacterized protein n=1 Tax=Podospora pseudocomata TaxID=2093779 RepID=A0ABR0GYG5_9PEZI|nr:hypothetical protein QC762_0023110 [Podospora pseudocomata]